MSEATMRDRSEAHVDPFYVSRQDLYAEYRWLEPFRKFRAASTPHSLHHSRFGPSCSARTYTSPLQTLASPYKLMYAV